MKRFLLMLLSFFIVFFLLEKASWYFINKAPEKEHDRRLEKVVTGSFNKELIIIGSSRGANNILACQLEDETGLSSYNLSYKGVDIFFQLFILETYLQFNPSPKKVLLLLDHKHTFAKGNPLLFRDDLLFSFSKYNYINNKLIARGKRNYGSKIFGLLRLNRKDFSTKKKKVLPNEVLADCGSMPNTIKRPITLHYQDDNLIYQVNNENPEKIEAFKAIQKLCQTNNIKLITVFPPNYKAFDFGFMKRFIQLNNSENSVLIYDTINPIYINESIYFDESHLIRDGAKIFTSEISEFINSNK
ncbi:hypothetical protein [Algibacter lectus]|nr:hypothetical protein [Algibacter lectus]